MGRTIQPQEAQKSQEEKGETELPAFCVSCASCGKMLQRHISRKGAEGDDLATRGTKTTGRKRRNGIACILCLLCILWQNVSKAYLPQRRGGGGRFSHKRHKNHRKKKGNGIAGILCLLCSLWQNTLQRHLTRRRKGAEGGPFHLFPVAAVSVGISVFDVPFNSASLSRFISWAATMATMPKRI